MSQLQIPVCTVLTQDRAETRKQSISILCSFDVLSSWCMGVIMKFVMGMTNQCGGQVSG